MCFKFLQPKVIEGKKIDCALADPHLPRARLLGGAPQLFTTNLVLLALLDHEIPGGAVTESTGAFSADLDRVLGQLARTARAGGSIDHTPYGTSRASTRSHYTFHSAAISAAIVTADALTIQNSAAALGFELTLERPSRSRPALVGSAAIAVGAALDACVGSIASERIPPGHW